MACLRRFRPARPGLTWESFTEALRTTGIDGSVLLEHLAPDSYVVLVTVPGREPRESRVDVAEGEESAIRVRVDAR